MEKISNIFIVVLSRRQQVESAVIQFPFHIVILGLSLEPMA